MKTWEELDQRVEWLILKMIGRDVSFHPPATGRRLANIKQNSPEGYAWLVEYQELIALEKEKLATGEWVKSR